VAPGVDLVGARRELASLELALAGEHHREQFLSDALEEAQGYDVVVVDCPPNLGLLTVNAFVAAAEVLVPVDMTDEGALQGAAEVRGIVDRLAHHSAVSVRALLRRRSIAAGSSTGRWTRRSTRSGCRSPGPRSR
jgi:chromosome partitioning protein